MSVLGISDILPIYKTYIDAIIDELGKYVTLYFENTVSNVQGEFNDPVRSDGSRLPSYKSTNSVPSPTVVENTKVVQALMKFNPEDFQRYGIKVNQPNSTLRLKTYIEHASDLVRAKYIIPNIADNPLLGQQQKFKLVREPIPVGLQLNLYCVSYWERM